MVGTLERAVQVLVTVAGQDGTPVDADQEKELLTVLEPSTMRGVVVVVTHVDTFELPTSDMFVTALFESAAHGDDKLASLDEELVG